jgi:hypothetical protein
MEQPFHPTKFSIPEIAPRAAPGKWIAKAKELVQDVVGQISNTLEENRCHLTNFLPSQVCLIQSGILDDISVQGRRYNPMISDEPTRNQVAIGE